MTAPLPTPLAVQDPAQPVALFTGTGTVSRGQRAIAIRVRLHNHTKNHTGTPSAVLDFTLRYAGGVAFGSTDYPPGIALGRYVPPTATVKPGRSLTGVLYFVIPAAASGLTVMYRERLTGHKPPTYQWRLG